MTLAAIDLETTGDNPSIDVPVEIGVCWMGARDGDNFSSLLHPGDVPISPVASAVHHLTMDNFRKEKSIRPTQSWWTTTFKEATYLAAHNAGFDSQFVPLGKRWICTWRCSLHLYPDAPKHSLQALRYYLDLKPELPKDLYPHRALYDALVLKSLLRKMLERHTEERLHNMTYEPLLLKRVNFGKYRGEEYSELPDTYLRWILRSDFDEDVKYTVRDVLEQRRLQDEERKGKLIEWTGI